MSVVLHENPLFNGRGAYRLGVAAAAGSALFLIYLMAAVGVMAESGYHGDLAYVGLLAVMTGGAAVSRGRADRLAHTMASTSVAFVGIGLAALVGGVHERAATSVPELLGLNAMFALGFAVAALLLKRA